MQVQYRPKPFGKNYANVLRFMHSIPTLFYDLCDTWIAMPKGPVAHASIYSDDYSGIYGYFKCTLES